MVTEVIENQQKAYNNNFLENTESRKGKEWFQTHPQKGPLLHQTLDE
jgi:hypothetical protein